MIYSARQKIGLILGPTLFILILFLPAPSGLTLSAHKTMAVAILMAIWWITEAIPIPATALIPLAAFPFLGISTAKSTSASYGHHFIFLFMGGFFVAMAMQRWKLHNRIALYIIGFVGTSPKKIVLGFMCSTAFLSMWISNTATTIMMLPIAMAVTSHIRESDSKSLNKKNSDNFLTALMLGIAYSASIGGIGTLIGTPPNIVFAGAVKSLYPGMEEIGYFQWMLVGVPVVLLFLPISWYLLTCHIFPIKLKTIPGGKKLIKEQIKNLGRMQKGEKYVMIIAIATAICWIFRKDINLGFFIVPGWSDVMGVSKYVHDSTVAILASLFLFSIPVDMKKGVFLLNWECALKVPWGILILFGGGIALANGFKVSGLAEWIGQSLSLISGVPTILMIIITAAVMTFLTEITSNTATTTIFMPILAATANAINIHPFLLMIPATISASCAFMLPVATPPNAIVFGEGHITMPQMVKAGLWLNLIGILIVTLVVYFIAIPVFGI